MKILVIYNDKILAWLVGEESSSAEAHIQNGYPELTEGYAAGTVKAVNIDVPLDDAFKADLYTVSNGEIARRDD